MYGGPPGQGYQGYMGMNGPLQGDNNQGWYKGGYPQPGPYGDQNQFGGTFRMNQPHYDGRQPTPQYPANQMYDERGRGMNIADRDIGRPVSDSQRPGIGQQQQCPDGNMLNTHGNTQTPGSNISDQGGNMANQGGNVAKQGQNVANQGGNVANQGGDVANQVGNLPNQTGNLPSQPGNLPNQGGNLPNQGGNLPNQGGNLPNQGGNLPNQTDDVPNQGDNVSTQDGNMPSQGGKLPSQGDNMPNQDSNMPNQGSNSINQGGNLQNQDGNMPDQDRKLQNQGSDQPKQVADPSENILSHVLNQAGNTSGSNQFSNMQSQGPSMHDQGGYQGGNMHNQGGNHGGNMHSQGGNQGGNIHSQGGNQGGNMHNQGGNQGGNMHNQGGNQGGNMHSQGGNQGGNMHSQGGNQGGNMHNQGGYQGGNMHSQGGNMHNQGGNQGVNMHNQGGNQGVNLPGHQSGIIPEFCGNNQGGNFSNKSGNMHGQYGNMPGNFQNQGSHMYNQGGGMHGNDGKNITPMPMYYKKGSSAPQMPGGHMGPQHMGDNIPQSPVPPSMPDNNPTSDPRVSQSPQQVADSILEMASSNYPGGGPHNTDVGRYKHSNYGMNPGPGPQQNMMYNNPNRFPVPPQSGQYPYPNNPNQIGTNQMNNNQINTNQINANQINTNQLNIRSPMSPLPVSPASMNSNQSLPSASPSPKQNPRPLRSPVGMGTAPENRCRSALSSASSPGMAPVQSPNLAMQQPMCPPYRNNVSMPSPMPQMQSMNQPPHSSMHHMHPLGPHHSQSSAMQMGPRPSMQMHQGHYPPSGAPNPRPDGSPYGRDCGPPNSESNTYINLMPPNSHSMPPNSHSMPLNSRSMPLNSRSMPPNSRTMAPHNRSPSANYNTLPSQQSTSMPSPYSSQFPRNNNDPFNPLQSLQRLVMLPESGVVDPKSVVRDANMVSPCDLNNYEEMFRQEGFESMPGRYSMPPNEQDHSSVSRPCPDGMHCGTEDELDPALSHPEQFPQNVPPLKTKGKSRRGRKPATHVASTHVASTVGSEGTLLEAPRETKGKSPSRRGRKPRSSPSSDKPKRRRRSSGHWSPRSQPNASDAAEDYCDEDFLPPRTLHSPKSCPRSPSSLRKSPRKTPPLTPPSKCLPSDIEASIRRCTVELEDISPLKNGKSLLYNLGGCGLLSRKSLDNNNMLCTQKKRLNGKSEIVIPKDDELIKCDLKSSPRSKRRRRRSGHSENSDVEPLPSVKENGIKLKIIKSKCILSPVNGKSRKAVNNHLITTKVKKCVANRVPVDLCRNELLQEKAVLPGKSSSDGEHESELWTLSKEQPNNNVKCMKIDSEGPKDTEDCVDDNPGSVCSNGSPNEDSMCLDFYREDADPGDDTDIPVCSEDTKVSMYEHSGESDNKESMDNDFENDVGNEGCSEDNAVMIDELCKKEVMDHSFSNDIAYEGCSEDLAVSSDEKSSERDMDNDFENDIVKEECSEDNTVSDDEKSSGKDMEESDNSLANDIVSEGLCVTTSHMLSKNQELEDNEEMENVSEKLTMSSDDTNCDSSTSEDLKCESYDKQEHVKIEESAFSSEKFHSDDESKTDEESESESIDELEHVKIKEITINSENLNSKDDLETSEESKSGSIDKKEHGKKEEIAINSEKFHSTDVSEMNEESKCVSIDKFQNHGKKLSSEERCVESSVEFSDESGKMEDNLSDRPDAVMDEKSSKDRNQAKDAALSNKVANDHDDVDSDVISCKTDSNLLLSDSNATEMECVENRELADQSSSMKYDVVESSPGVTMDTVAQDSIIGSDSEVALDESGELQQDVYEGSVLGAMYIESDAVEESEGLSTNPVKTPCQEGEHCEPDLEEHVEGANTFISDLKDAVVPEERPVFDQSDASSYIGRDYDSGICNGASPSTNSDSPTKVSDKENPVECVLRRGRRRRPTAKSSKYLAYSSDEELHLDGATPPKRARKVTSRSPKLLCVENRNQNKSFKAVMVSTFASHQDNPQDAKIPGAPLQCNRKLKKSSLDVIVNRLNQQVVGKQVLTVAPVHVSDSVDEVAISPETPDDGSCNHGNHSNGKHTSGRRKPKNSPLKPINSDSSNDASFVKPLCSECSNDRNHNSFEDVKSQLDTNNFNSHSANSDSQAGNLQAQSNGPGTHSSAVTNSDKDLARDQFKMETDKVEEDSKPSLMDCDTSVQPTPGVSGNSVCSKKKAPSRRSKPSVRRPRSAKTGKRAKGSSAFADCVSDDEQLKKALKIGKKGKHNRSKAKTVDQSQTGPFVKVKGTKDAPQRCEVVNLRHVDVDKNSKRSRVHTKPQSCLDAGSAALAKMSSSQPWLCAFCGHGSNHDVLGDLFGPYFIEKSCTSASPSKEPSLSPKARSSKDTSGNVKGKSRKRKGSPERKTDKGKSLVAPPSKRSSKAQLTSPASKDVEPHREIWLHEDCIVWTSGIFAMGGKLHGLEDALQEAKHSVSVSLL